jgi:hypothetical protein
MDSVSPRVELIALGCCPANYRRMTCFPTSPRRGRSCTNSPRQIPLGCPHAQTETGLLQQTQIWGFDGEGVLHGLLKQPVRHACGRMRSMKPLSFLWRTLDRDRCG